MEEPKVLTNGRSYFSLLVDCLEHGMPIITDMAMIRQYGSEIKHAVHSSERGDCYMGDLGWDYVYSRAQKLTEEEVNDLVFKLTHVKQAINKGSKKEDLNFTYENKFFSSLSSIIPKKA